MKKEKTMLAASPKDIMTTHLITVKRDTPILDAMELLAAYNVSGLPVIDDENNLIGVLSEKDVIALINAQSDTEQQTVADFMTQPALCFEVDESLNDVCDFLKKNVFRRVPITSKGKLAGIISIRDVVEFILRQRGRVLGAAYAAGE
ncbi:MAG: CBS domain-containing protein [Planctomycetota bacterium]